MPKKIRWWTLGFLFLATAVTLLACPVYLWHRTLEAPALALFIFYVLATSFSITMGYHRLFSHAAFKAHAIVRLFVLFFGAAAFEQSALKWSSLHRHHHRFVDTDQDPYNIKRGFFYAHAGWLLFSKTPVDYANVEDLKKDALLMHQHHHYKLWSFTAGLILPLAVGLATGHLVEAFLFSVGARLFLVLNSAFFINSYAHTFGSRDFDRHSSARDHWLGAILTNGEGYHNYHHRFPSDYRNGIYWYHWDPTKWLIKLLSWTGLTSELKSTPPSAVIEARRAALSA